MRYRVYFFVMALAGGILFFCNTGRVSGLEVGERAPAFTLPATTAEKMTLADYLGNKHVVLFFYIAAFGQA
jgi:peroxiredoxin